MCFQKVNRRVKMTPSERHVGFPSHILPGQTNVSRREEGQKAVLQKTLQLPRQKWDSEQWNQGCWEENTASKIPSRPSLCISRDHTHITDENVPEPWWPSSLHGCQLQCPCPRPPALYDTSQRFQLSVSRPSESTSARWLEPEERASLNIPLGITPKAAA